MRKSYKFCVLFSKLNDITGIKSHGQLYEQTNDIKICIEKVQKWIQNGEKLLVPRN